MKQLANLYFHVFIVEVYIFYKQNKHPKAKMFMAITVRVRSRS